MRYCELQVLLSLDNYDHVPHHLEPITSMPTPSRTRNQNKRLGITDMADMDVQTAINIQTTFSAYGHRLYDFRVLYHIISIASESLYLSQKPT